ncbi:MAG: elongation factor P [Bacilli bacterium]|nr:elongation factor P [Bacilli bacterium]
MNVTEIRPGNYFIDENVLYRCIDILLNKTAMRKMVAKLKVLNVRTGAITEISRNSGYDVTPASLDKRNMQYSYEMDPVIVFMDPKTYDQVEIAKSQLTNELPYLVPELEVMVISFEGEVLGIQLPAKVALTVTECEPGVRGDTITNSGSKEATLETGLKLRIPLFINQGDKITVDTTTGKYDGRA